MYMKPWILPVLLGALILGLSSSLVAGSSVQLVGAGLIGNPVPGKTITSPSLASQLRRTGARSSVAWQGR